jgi:hypothetical protein
VGRLLAHKSDLLTGCSQTPFAIPCSRSAHNDENLDYARRLGSLQRASSGVESVPSSLREDLGASAAGLNDSHPGHNARRAPTASDKVGPIGQTTSIAHGRSITCVITRGIGRYGVITHAAGQRFPFVRFRSVTGAWPIRGTVLSRRERPRGSLEFSDVMRPRAREAVQGLMAGSQLAGRCR